MGVDDSRRPGFDDWVSMKGQGEANDPELNDNGHRARVEGYVTDIFTDRALAFVQRPRAKPFVLYLAHKALHPNIAQGADGSVTNIGEGGFIPATRHKDLYAADVPPRRPNAAIPPIDKPALRRRIGGLPPLGPATGTDDTTIRDRWRMLAAVDESVGRILAALERSHQLDDTVFVLTSDHGYFYGEHGLSLERRLAYEEAIRIPLFIRYPRVIKAGLVPAQFALTIDLAPTLLELAGAAPFAPAQGRSLVPLLEGRSPRWRNSFLIEYSSDTVFPRMVAMGYDAVRGERYKYIRYRELKGMDELYDLGSDPYEMTNRIDDPRAAGARARMRAELERLILAAPAAR
jgi:N-acetylglucosamine-6-sulfatase